MAMEPPPETVADHTTKHKRPRSISVSSSESHHSTRTLHNEDLEFVHENGRIYGNDSYYMPCDEAEQDRLALQHQIFVMALKGKLTTTKVTPLTRRILDLGTGPGHWAVAMAQAYPWAEVVGIDTAIWDIDTTEEIAGNADVKWELDDLDVWGVEDEVDDLMLQLERASLARDLGSNVRARTSPSTQPQTPSESAYDLYVLNPLEQPGWHFSEPYDLIHMRGMKGVFAYWEGVYDEIYKNLTPGGWIEVADFHLELPFMEEDEPATAATASQQGDTASIRDPSTSTTFPFPTLAKLHLALLQASVKSGRPVGTFYMHPTYLTDAGFKDVTTTYVNVPVGQWPADEEQRRIGKLFLVNVMEMLEPNLLRLLTTYGDRDRVWGADEVRAGIETGKEEILEWHRGIEGRRERGEREWEWNASYKWMTGRKL